MQFSATGEPDDVAKTAKVKEKKEGAPEKLLVWDENMRFATIVRPFDRSTWVQGLPQRPWHSPAAASPVALERAWWSTLA